jgi:hypothetical protein
MQCCGQHRAAEWTKPTVPADVELDASPPPPSRTRTRRRAGAAARSQVAGLVVRDRPHHQGWDVQLTAYAARDGRANFFFPVGIAHSVVGGSAWEPTPWRAVQRAARPFRARGYPVTPAPYVVATFAC